MLLCDKVAMVTGAASGIGREIAKVFAREGAWVALADVDHAGAIEAARTIDPSGRRTMAIAMDVANEQSVEEATSTVVNALGGLDILVSNAGTQMFGPVVEVEFAKWKQVLAVHLDGAFLSTRAALRQMFQQKSGCIIYMGDAFSKESALLRASYATAMHGLIGLCKVVAMEGAAYGVRANVICPSFVQTPRADMLMSEEAEALGISKELLVRDMILGKTVTGEFTTVDDVVEVALFLASFASNALTGQSFFVSH